MEWGIHHNSVAPCFWLQDHLKHSELLNQTKRRNLSTNGFPSYILSFQVQKATHHMQDDRSYAVAKIWKRKYFKSGVLYPCTDVHFAGLTDNRIDDTEQKPPL